jgi:hypothetical protein
MGMAYQSGMCGLLAAGVQESFEVSGGTVDEE